MLESCEQYAKGLKPIELTLFGIVTVLRLVYENACSPIETRLDGSVTDVSFWSVKA